MPTRISPPPRCVEPLEARRLLSGDAAAAKADFAGSVDTALVVTMNQPASVSEQVAAFQAASNDFAEYVELGSIDADVMAGKVAALQGVADTLRTRIAMSDVTIAETVDFSEAFVGTYTASAQFSAVQAAADPATQPGGGDATPPADGAGGDAPATQPDGAEPGAGGGANPAPAAPPVDPDGNGRSGDINRDGVVDKLDLAGALNGVLRNFDKPGPLGLELHLKILQDVIGDYLAVPKKPPADGGNDIV